jgi:hypothetical protein
MARSLEFRPEFQVVVDLAAEYDPHGAIFVVNRLVACGQIDDAQPTHAKTHTRFNVNPFVVGTAMADDVAHRVNQRQVAIRARRRSAFLRTIGKSSNATHGLIHPCSRGVLLMHERGHIRDGHAEDFNRKLSRKDRRIRLSHDGAVNHDR